jgi:hypothetical protein
MPWSSFPSSVLTHFLPDKKKLHLPPFALVVNLSSMSTVAEIESAISTLPVKDAWSVANWLQEYLDAKWDKEMDEDIAAGRVKPLDEVINHG